MKKYLAGILLLFALLLIPNDVYAAEFEKLEVTTGKTDVDCQDNATINRSLVAVDPDKTKQNVYRYTFTLKEDSVVYFSLDTDIAAGEEYTKITANYAIYKDKTMSNEVWSKSNPVSGLQNWTMTKELKAGDYYCDLRVSAYDNFWHEAEGYGDHELRTTIMAVPLSDICTLKYKVKGSEVTASVTNNIESWMPYMWQALSTSTQGAFTSEYRKNSGEEKIRSISNVKQYGETLLICLANDYNEFSGNSYGDEVRILRKLDITPPKVSGAKSGATYNKSVKISCSDKETGVSRVTLDGKKVDKKFSVSKSGKHVIKVVDKVGNVKKVTFTIKK